MKIFITGGAGYIGSHTCVELLSLNKVIVGCDAVIHLAGLKAVV